MFEKSKNSIAYKFSVTLFLIAFSFFTLIIVFCKRTTFSSYEKRPTKNFPTFTFQNLKSSEFFKNIDEYLIDSVPFRDIFLDKVNYILKYKGLQNTSTNISEIAFKNETTPTSEPTIKKAIATASTILETEIASNNDEFPSYNEYPKPTLYMVKNGAIIIGDGNSIRGMFGPGHWIDSNKVYAEIVNEYAKTFPDINIYTMIIPMAIAYYASPKDKIYQTNTINSVRTLSSYFDPSIIQVDVYNALLPHMAEDIYLRTDHHWAQLGAYYAAKEFAKVANVNFESLDKYDSHSIDKFCGTMYQSTGVTEFKSIGETFTYYTPNSINYTTEQCFFKIGSDQKAISRGDFVERDFFYDMFINKGEAYMVFMAGDSNITHVKTETKNGRSLLILKDSFGNAVVPNLFYSFENIWVVDYRYFVESFEEFVKEREISDILFINSISSCKTSGAALYRKILNMK